MDTLLLKMAQRASDDSSLMASLIQAHAHQHNLSWPQIAAELTLDEEQLARLALCRCPNGQSTSDEIRQIAAYVDMSSTELTAFIRRNSARNGGAQTAARPLPAQPKQQRDSFAWPSFKREKNPMFNRRTVAFALAAIVFMVFAAFAFAQPSGSEATLVVSAGQATVQQGETLFLIVPRQTQTTVAAGSILTVNQGDRIAVPDGSAAQLSLYDGSTVEIAGGSTLEISELVTNGRTYRVQLSLAAGRTLSRVVKLLGTDDRFEVRTPSSTASVRGTVFTVAAISNTESYIAVDEGIVRVTLGAEFVDVNPGQAVMAVVGQPLTPMGQTPDNPAGVPTTQPSVQSPVQSDNTGVGTGTQTNTPATETPATETPVTATAVPGSPIDSVPVVTDTVSGPTVTPAPGTCTGGEIQPTGLTLAQRYDVSYDEIMGWFCAGFGFGTIDLAYSLSQETGADVSVIFTMSANGMGWGQIRNQLLGNPGNNGNPGGNNGNPGGNNGNPGGNNGNPGGNSGNPGGNSGNPGGNNGSPGGNPGDPGGNSGNPGGNTGDNSGNTGGNSGNNDNGGQAPPEPPAPPAGPPESPPGNNGGDNGNNGNGNNGNNGNGGNR